MSRTHREVSDLEWRMTRAEAERAVCPRCHAAIGEPCTNTFGDELRAPAHFQRINAAQELEAP
jgi:hypothetical protein